MLHSDEVGEELSDQSGAGSPQPCPVEIVARSRTATPRVEHVSIVADDPISGNPDNVKQWWEEIQLMHDADEVGGMKVARTLLDIPAEKFKLTTCQFERSLARRARRILMMMT